MVKKRTKPPGLTSAVDKAKRRAADEILRRLFEKAYAEGRVEISYTNRMERPEVLQQQAHKLWYSVRNYRDKIRRRPLKNLELLHKIELCSVCRPNKFTVSIERKLTLANDATRGVLSLAATHADIVGEAFPGTVPNILPKV